MKLFPRAFEQGPSRSLSNFDVVVRSNYLTNSSTYQHEISSDGIKLKPQPRLRRECQINAK